MTPRGKLLCATVVSLVLSYTFPAWLARAAGADSDRARAGLVGPVMTLVERANDPTGPVSLSATYDPAGNLVEQVRYLGARVALRSLTLRDAGNLVLRTATLRYGSDGLAAPSGWADTDFTYDSRGTEVSAIDYDFQGSPVSTTHITATYGAANRVTKSQRNVQTGGHTTAQTVTFSYDATGRLEKEAWYATPGVLQRRVVYAYNPAGRKTSSKSLAADGTVAFAEGWQYDNGGHVVTYTAKGAGSDVKRTWRYDSTGSLLGSESFSGGKLTESMQVDAKARVSYVTTYLPDAKSTTVLSDKGLTQREVRRALDGTLQREAVYRYDFDTLGNWVKLTRTTTNAVGATPAEPAVDTTYRALVYYPDDPAALSAFYEAAGRVQVRTAGMVRGLGDTTLTFSRTLASGASTVVTDPAGNWFVSGVSGAVDVTPASPGYAFTPKTAQLTPANRRAVFEGAKIAGAGSEVPSPAVGATPVPGTLGASPSGGAPASPNATVPTATPGAAPVHAAPASGATTVGQAVPTVASGQTGVPAVVGAAGSGTGPAVAPTAGATGGPRPGSPVAEGAASAASAAAAGSVAAEGAAAVEGASAVGSAAETGSVTAATGSVTAAAGSTTAAAASATAAAGSVTAAAWVAPKAGPVGPHLIVLPCLGYSVGVGLGPASPLDKLRVSGPLAGIRLSVDRVKVRPDLRYQRVIGLGGVPSGVEESVEVGVGIAPAPRLGTKLVLASGLGYTRILRGGSDLLAKGPHLYCEAELGLGKAEVGAGPQVEFGVGARLADLTLASGTPPSGRALRVAGYARFAARGDTKLAALMLLLGAVLAFVNP